MVQSCALRPLDDAVFSHEHIVQHCPSWFLCKSIKPSNTVQEGVNTRPYKQEGDFLVTHILLSKIGKCACKVYRAGRHPQSQSGRSFPIVSLLFCVFFNTLLDIKS